MNGPIILISIDTLRADHLPAYGYKELATPAIDRLATEGILFERAYSHVPLTLPAHASILSGVLPFEHGVRDNVGFSVRPDQQLLPGWLREVGFETGGIVSADVLRKDTGIAHGFDFYDCQMPPVSGDVSSDRVRRDGLQSLNVAERWMDQRRSSRFFLFLHLYEPHAPYTPRPQFARYQPYDAEIAYADEIVGRFVSSLQRRDLYHSATIILLSDHGEGLGDHGEPEHGLFLYQETLRIPLIIKMPESREHGQHVSQPVQQIDLVPTILDLLGRPVSRTLRGRSLRSFLEGHAGNESEALIYSESLYGRYHFGWSELTALTDQRFRFIHAPRDELYDLSADPREQQNLVAARPQTAVAMRNALTETIRGATIHPPQLVRQEELQRLASLGYLNMQADVSPNTSGEGLPDPKDKIGVLRSYQRVLVLVQQQNIPAAINLLRGVLNDEPSMADLWFQLGNLLTQTGRTSEAVEAYRHVIRENPRSTSSALALSSALLKCGRFDEARSAAELVSAVGSSHERRDLAAAHELLARIALAQNDPAAARREAAAANAADPFLPMTEYVEGQLQYSAGNYAKALESFEGALRATPDRTRQVADLHLYTGDTLARLGRVFEAEQQFAAELQFFPRNVWAFASLANLYHAEQRDVECNRVLDQLLRTSQSPEAYSLAVRLLTSFGETEKAAAIRATSHRLFGTGSSR